MIVSETGFTYSLFVASSVVQDAVVALAAFAFACCQGRAECAHAAAFPAVAHDSSFESDLQGRQVLAMAAVVAM